MEKNVIKVKLTSIIVIIIIGLGILGVLLFIKNNEIKNNKENITNNETISEEKDESVIIGDRLLISIANEKYDYASREKIKEEGCYIYNNGVVQKYNKINNIEAYIKTLSKEEIEELIELIKEIDKAAIITKNTLNPITEGRIIVVYNLEKREKILIQDFYSENYSEASVKIRQLLKKYELMD